MRSLFWMEVLCQRTRFWILFLLRFAFSFLSNLPTFSFKVSVFWVFRNLDLHQSSKSIFLCYLLEALACSLSHLYLPSTWNWVLGKGGIGIRILFFLAVIFSWPLKNHAVLTALHITDQGTVDPFLDSAPVPFFWPGQTHSRGLFCTDNRCQVIVLSLQTALCWAICPLLLLALRTMWHCLPAGPRDKSGSFFPN